jgi:exodeoxyribonuclease VII small subunit
VTPPLGDEHQDTAPPVAALGYSEALRELEAILDRLEGASVDVDTLAANVSRASALIRHCRERIGAARFEIEQVVGELDTD